MNSKKAITLLVLATLIMGLIPIANAAIGITSVTPGSGGKGDTIIVLGSGVTAGKSVNLYWDYVQAWNGEAGLLNSTKAKPSGEFNITFKVPAATNGEHYLWVEDAQTLNVDNEPFMVIAVLKLSSTSGLAGDKITVNGYGFSDDEDAWIRFGAVIPGSNLTKTSTDAVGSLTKEVTIPTGTADGAYFMYAIDNKGIDANKAFTVGPVITINKDSGPTGTVVQISGRGFTPSTTSPAYTNFVSLITVGGVEAYNTSSGQIKVSTRGEFKTSIVIPAGDGVTTLDEDEYDIVVTTDAADTADVSFEITGLPDITLTPEFGGVNELISISGENFTQIRDTKVYIYLDGSEAGTLKTASDGTFSGTFRVPAAANGIYEINAGPHDQNVNATHAFRVGLMIVLINPSSGPQGAKVTLSGVGFVETVGEDWNASMGGVLVKEGTANNDGVFTETFYVPNIAPGTYPVEVYDIDAEITVTVDFTVTDVTYIELIPPQAANDYNITINGYHFSEDESATYDFVLFNATDEWDITDVEPQTVYDNGNFTGYWVVYDSDTLSLGTYTLNVTDSNDIFAQIQFDIVEEVVNVSPKRETYQVGDTVAFNIVSTFKQEGAYFKIYDPAGNLYWKTDALNTWVKVGFEQVVPFYAQTSGQNPMILVPDAPLGTWSWKMYNVDDDLIEEGTFVVEASSASQLQSEIEDLNTAVNNLQTEIGTVSDSIASVKSDVQSAITAANAAVNAANAATQAVNQVSSVASDAAKAAQDAATAAENAQNAANGLTTLVYGAIGASLVAAIAAIVSLMQISRRIAG
jgi:hypothetical protein